MFFQIALLCFAREYTAVGPASPGNDLAEKIYYACLSAGLSFKISQGSVLTLSPPLTISRTDLDRALDIVVNAIREVA